MNVPRPLQHWIFGVHIRGPRLKWLIKTSISRTYFNGIYSEMLVT